MSRHSRHRRRGRWPTAPRWRGCARYPVSKCTRDGLEKTFAERVMILSRRVAPTDYRAQKTTQRRTGPRPRVSCGPRTCTDQDSGSVGAQPKPTRGRGAQRLLYPEKQSGWLQAWLDPGASLAPSSCLGGFPVLHPQAASPQVLATVPPAQLPHGGWRGRKRPGRPLADLARVSLSCLDRLAGRAVSVGSNGRRSRGAGRGSLANGGCTSLSLPEEPAGGSQATRPGRSGWPDQEGAAGRGRGLPEPGGPGRDVAF